MATAAEHLPLLRSENWTTESNNHRCRVGSWLYRSFQLLRACSRRPSPIAERLSLNVGTREGACAWICFTCISCHTSQQAHDLHKSHTESSGKEIQDNWSWVTCCSLRLPSQSFSSPGNFIRLIRRWEPELWGLLDRSSSGLSSSTLPPWVTLSEAIADGIALGFLAPRRLLHRGEVTIHHKDKAG